MSCPHCLSASISKRKRRTSLGYRTFNCGDCDRRFNERSGSPFNDLQFPTDIVLLAVLWRLRCKLGFRDVAELLLQRGFEVSHETIRVWEFRFTPLISENLRSKRCGAAGHSWYLDETYIKVSGRWRYLYRAIDREGRTPVDEQQLQALRYAQGTDMKPTTQMVFLMIVSKASGRDRFKLNDSNLANAVGVHRGTVVSAKKKLANGTFLKIKGNIYTFL